MKHIYSFDFNFFSKKNNTFFYFLGLMASDGNITPNNKRFSLGQSGEHGKDLITFLLNKMGSNHKIYNRKNHFSFSISNEKVVKILSKYNIKPKKTLTYEIPDFNVKELKLFLQGYLDGDGCVGIYDNGLGVKYLSISMVGTERFVKKLNNILSIKGNIRKIGRCKNLFDIRFNGKNAVDLGHFIYDDICYNSYKYNKFKSFINDGDMGNKYMKYYNIKNDIILELKNGVKPIDLQKKYGLPYKTIYTWKTRYVN